MPQPEVFLGDGMVSLQELISGRWPGAVLSFTWMNAHAEPDVMMHIRDLAGDKWSGLGSFHIVQNGEEVAAAQIFVNMKYF